MNKKKIILAVVLVLALALVLAFCGKKEVISEPDPTVAVQSTETVESTGETVVAEATEETTPETTVETTPNEEEVPTEATTEPTESDKPISDEFIEENVNVGVAEGGGTEDIKESGGSAPTPQVTTPAEENTNTEPVVLDVAISDITYDMYMAMSAGQQEAVINSFGSMDDFMVWLNYIKAQYEAEHPNIEVGPDGSVDLG